MEIRNLAIKNIMTKETVFYALAAAFALYFTLVYFGANAPAIFNAFPYKEAVPPTLVILFVGMMLFCLVLYSMLFIANHSTRLCVTIQQERSKFPLKTFGISFLCAFLAYGCSLVARWPGAAGWDTVYQWKQIRGEIQYTDIHPAIHTKFLALLLSICDNFWFVIIAQIFLFSFALAYFIATLKSWGVGRIFLFLILFLNVININIHTWLLIPYKDILLSTLLLMTFAFVANIYFSKGNWLQKKRNIGLLAFFIVLSSLMRHNAPLLTFTLLAALLFSFPKLRRKTISLSIIVFLTFLGVKFPLYSFWNVEKTSDCTRRIELYGIPMTIIGDVRLKNSNALPSNVKNVMDSLSTEKWWKQNYRAGNFGSVKWKKSDKSKEWNVGADSGNIEPSKMLSMTLETIFADPLNSVLAIRETTRMVWEIDGQPIGTGFLIKNPAENKEMGIPYIENATTNFARTCSMSLFAFSEFPFVKWLSWKTGVQMLLLFGAIVIVFRRNHLLNRNQLNRNENHPVFTNTDALRAGLLFVLPLFAYNLGTMLLSFGPSYRFYLFNAILVTPLLIIIFAQVQQGKNPPET